MLSEAELTPIHSNSDGDFVYQEILANDNFIEIYATEDGYILEYFKKVGEDAYNSYTLAKVIFEKTID